jgi:hypothetical protein
MQRYLHKEKIFMGILSNRWRIRSDNYKIGTLILSLKSRYYQIISSKLRLYPEKGEKIPYSNIKIR